MEEPAAPVSPGQYSGLRAGTAVADRPVTQGDLDLVEQVQLAGQAFHNFFERERLAVSWREFLVIGLLVALADVTIYFGQGFAGYAAFLAAAPLLVALGARTRQRGWQAAIVMLMSWAAAARLVWCGNGLAFALGLMLLGCVSISLSGGAVYILDLLRFLGALLPAGAAGVVTYGLWLKSLVGRWFRMPSLSHALAWLLPPIAAAVFLAIFVMANPDVMQWIDHKLTVLLQEIERFLGDIVSSTLRVFFWIGIAWLSIGLLRPFIPTPGQEAGELPVGAEPQACELYLAFRNTLQVLIVLFVAYLGFEFSTLAFRVFPPKFHYSGYAHEGAAWLTVALALATLTLSAMFRGPMLLDPRMPALRRLAMVWAFLNLLLAVAVFNRLFIYIGFNGMTRMRVVGMLGISTVIAGLVLVVLKMWRGKSFAWVVRNQAVALAIAVYLYAVLPVDTWVMSYNVRQVLRGNIPPCVQIMHHPTSPEGALRLLPLLDNPDPMIREGITEFLFDTRQMLNGRKSTDWTGYQIADARLLKALDHPSRRVTEKDFSPGAAERLKLYTYQWY